MSAASGVGAGGTVCVIGSFMMDLTVEAPRRPQPGETLRGTAFRQTTGGKGYNQAVAAARTGARTLLLGALGKDDFAAQFRASLTAEGIDHSGVLTDAAQGTGVAQLLVEPSGQNSIVIVPRANLSWQVSDVRAQAGAIGQASVVLTQFEVPMECVLEVARTAHHAGATMVVNPAPYAEMPPELLQYTDVLTPNETELLAIVDSDDDSTEGITAAATDLAGRSGLTVVATLGSRGALVAAPGQAGVLVPGRTVKAIDTVGAGDVFCGNLVAALARGEDLAAAVRVANVAASISVTRPGGGPSAPYLAETLSALG
ncbi:MAG: ribokinase [Bifidobacteriaceae bacterium]|jgi:ribokinase|nr:ribokinase [Bifidobacteriaceae bacterium]